MVFLTSQEMTTWDIQWLSPNEKQTAAICVNDHVYVCESVRAPLLHIGYCCVYVSDRRFIESTVLSGGIRCS